MNSDADDWEAKLESGKLSLPTPKEEDSAATNQHSSFPQLTTDKPERDGKGGSESIKTFDDILGGGHEPVKPAKAGPRPETTTVVARRFLAHALQNRDIIKRDEEAQLAKRREEKKRERVERRRVLDAMWEQD